MDKKRTGKYGEAKADDVIDYGSQGRLLVLPRRGDQREFKSCHVLRWALLGRHDQLEFRSVDWGEADLMRGR